MNIAFVNATIRWGGVKTWTLDFGESLRDKGHAVFIYGRQPEFIEAARRRVGHGERMNFGADLNPLTIRRFCRIFRENAIDVVIVNIEKDLATAGAAARLLGIPTVQRIGLPTDIPHRLKTRLLHAWIRPRFLCPCRYIAEGFLRLLPYVRENDVRVVLNGKKPVASDAACRLHAPRRFVCTQQLSHDKGHAVLLRAFAELRARRPDLDFEVHVHGTGKEEAPLKTLCSRLHLDASVVWRGFSSSVQDTLPENDIFLLASLSEGLPNTLLEGMAAGLLPICRDVGGVREVLSPGLDPWVLPFDADEHAFCAAMTAALDLSDDALLDLRREARAQRNCFDLESRADELAAWLGTLTDKARKENA